MTNRHKINIVESASSRINNYTYIFESGFKFRIVVSQGQIHRDDL